MIYTRLHGRLGNQMFQYAAAAGLAARVGTRVALDTRSAELRGERVLTRVFDLPLAEPESLPPARFENLPAYLFWRLTGRPPRFRRERGLQYNPQIESWGGETYLHGYWQSEKYFAHVADAIRRDFRFPDVSSAQNAEMAARIGTGLSISLHVRRGDYVTLGAHALCDRAYYEAALAAVLDGLDDDPTVYVFSDDPNWARKELPLPCERVIVDFNGPEQDFEDMRLMSLCRHNIIANSSFSWWAAWLNAHADKRIAGPRRWFGNPQLRNPDILPADWITVDA